MINLIGYLDCKKEPELMAFRNRVYCDIRKYDDIITRCVCFDKCSLETS
jgi:hypothetical protein